MKGCEKKMSNSRTRNFSLTSYLDETKIKLTLLAHQNQVRFYSYILHDKDTNEDGTLKEPHYHIIIITYNAKTVSALRRWFYGWVDKEGKDINTLGQKCNDIYNAYDYLYHKHNPEKYQYNPDDIVSNNKEYFLGSADTDIDTATQMLFDIVNNVSYRTMAKKYGRDFIFHYQNLRLLAYDMILEEKCFGKCDTLPEQRNIRID